MNKALITFVGNHDAWSDPEKKIIGPILSILKEIEFNQIYLLYSSDLYLQKAVEIRKYCEHQYPDLKIFYQETYAINPIDYNIVYPAMYGSIKQITEKNTEPVEYYISLTSGTPTMHACWLLLVKGRVIDAKMIQYSREIGLEEVNMELNDFPEIVPVTETQARLTQYSRENKILKQSLNQEFSQIIGDSPQIRDIKKRIEICSKYDIPVYIHGESGTGKELVARAIHFSGPRKENVFVAVNCAAINPNLFESEFFGHQKGAFTGAHRDYEGKFRQAHQGTLFLDEIGDLPPDMQVKLLRVLQDGRFHPVGSLEEISVDFRLISASNKNLNDLVAQGFFREDLFYRIVQDQIDLPSLRDREFDLVLLIRHILAELRVKYRKNISLSKPALEKLRSYNWPGNIRQLKSVLETAFIYGEDSIRVEDIRLARPLQSARFEITIPDEGIDLDGEVIPACYQAALEKAGNVASKAAKLLNIPPHTFRARLRSLKL